MLGEFLATLGRVTCKSKMNLLGHGLISEVGGCGLVQETPFGVSYARKPGPPGWKGDTRSISWQNRGEVHMR